MDFKQQLEAIKEHINGIITADMPTEQISQFADIKDELDALGNTHQQTLDEYGKLKDNYIKVVQGYGTGKAPANETSSVDQDVSLEQIGAEIISNRGKTQ